MPLAEDMKNIVEEIISSYENRIESIESIFESTTELLENSQNFLIDSRKDREKINAQLRENLAKNESLRKKDFDNMMQEILPPGDQKEKQIKDLLKSYFNEQREMAHILKNNLTEFKDLLAKGETQRIKNFQQTFKEIIAKQDERKAEVAAKLKEFQEDQKLLAERLKELLAKGSQLRIRDLKLTLKELNTERGERTAYHQKRREEVSCIRKETRDKLGEFRKERQNTRENRQNSQKRKV